MSVEVDQADARICETPECERRLTGAPTARYCSAGCWSKHRSLKSLPMEARTEAAERYRRGEHIGVLAADYGVDQQALRRALRQLGLTFDRKRAGAASWVARVGVPPDEGDLETGFRWCAGCRVQKPMAEYYWRTSESGPRTRMRQCKRCRYVANKANANLRASRRKYAYGMTGEQFDGLMAAQEGRCAICRGILSPESRGTHVDHCHFDSGVRGLLCHHCNTGLGLFREDPELLEAAARYIVGTNHWHPPMDAADQPQAAPIVYPQPKETPPCP